MERSDIRGGLSRISLRSIRATNRPNGKHARKIAAGDVLNGRDATGESQSHGKWDIQIEYLCLFNMLRDGTFYAFDKIGLFWSTQGLVSCSLGYMSTFPQ
jgi:hypothetical protein